MTTKQEISQWFDRGVTEGYSHMIVVCDTYDHEDYPVYARGDADCLNKHAHYDGLNMQRVMEVYDIRQTKEPQMQGRTMRLPVPV